MNTLHHACGYDEIKGTQNLKIYSHADPQILSHCAYLSVSRCVVTESAAQLANLTVFVSLLRDPLCLFHSCALACYVSLLLVWQCQVLDVTTWSRRHRHRLGISMLCAQNGSS